MGKLKKAESLLVKLESAALVALLGGMSSLAFLQVLRRELFGSGALWADPLLRSLVLWVGFLGAALAAAEDKHFAWEAGAHRSGRYGAALNLIGKLAAVCVSLLLMRAAWNFFLDDQSAGRPLALIGNLAVPSWLFSLAIPVGFALLAVHMALRAAEAAAKLR
ncbi:MAG: TRAP transporter small permease subunit [Elusimicrobia bacterium]|nr:TRAP transporter small permease subunit [Elusimicrobiota bacterium]MDE2424496.1 TRAP transporter small permease subunit [Elusimicrobiota bacterium]